MGELVRSADMVYLQILIPQEAAEGFADEMGRRDLMMFTDLNEHVQMFQRDYVKDITRINDADRAMKGIESMFLEFGALTEEDLELTPDMLMNTPRNSNVSLFELTDQVRNFYKSLSHQVFCQRLLSQQY